MSDQSHHSLESIEDADRWLARTEPSWLMKHSSRCPFSSWAIGEITAFLSMHPDQPAALVVVQEHPEVSDHIAQVTGIRHETPQVMLIRNGRVLWHASHGKVVGDEMLAAWTEHVEA